MILGTGSTRKAVKMTFTMVNSPTSYNVILGWPDLNRLRAIVSTTHLCMKYLVDNLVSVIRVDQGVARKCYDESTCVSEGRPRRHITSDEQPQVHFLELDPRFDREDARLQPDEDLKEIQKPSGKWRMYTDYTNLNKTCLKDPYPLPSIDALVDRASSCRLLSFMDAYLSYNHIRMHPNDESKMAFITDEGNFCYKVIPFGLKDVGATYQRLMDRIFKDHIGNQLEVYVDDMVVKSGMEVGHVENLVAIFRVLRRYQLRLKTEKFLGFMLTRRGIEANSEKCNAVIDMRSPRSVKEV
ncbi:Retrovirus-related Pol polyprotein from transposon opus, partial [Mucuna pruriens]